MSLRTLIAALLWLAWWPAQAQLADSLAHSGTWHITEVVIEGNDKTKDHLITREMAVKAGESYTAGKLDTLLNLDQQRLTNTNLFLTVALSLQPDSVQPHQASVLVSVEERWYIFPVPIFELADRNFNDWWVNQNADFSRVEWGMRFTHTNFRGRRERLSVVGQFGFTQRVAFRYYIPFLDKKQEWGVSLFSDYRENNSVAYVTAANVPLFLTDNTGNWLGRRWRSTASLLWRPNFFNTYSLDINQTNHQITDTLVSLQDQPGIPAYLGPNQTRQNYFGLGLGFMHEHRDYNAYPLSGFFLRLGASQQGLGISQSAPGITRLLAAGGYYWPLGEKGFYLGTELAVAALLGGPPPYAQRTGINYGDLQLRGYDTSVLEGRWHVLSKSALRFRLLERTYPTFIPLDEFDEVLVSLYPKIFVDAAYVENPWSNTINDLLLNRPVGAVGVGLDLVTFYDAVWSLEASYNAEGATQIFFNINQGF